MNLQEKAISEKEAKKLGGIPLSYPCSLQSEMWIIRNMIKDLDRDGVKYFLVRKTIETISPVRKYEKPALELWRMP
jgi:hypothetical protein